jgi:hypothetical protein
LVVAYSSVANRRLATIEFEIWDDVGEPRVLVDARLDDSDYELERIVALAIPLLAEDQMRVMSTKSQDLLETGLQDVVNRFKAGEKEIPDFSGQEATARYVATFRIYVFEGNRPFLINEPPAMGQYSPSWADDVEEASAVAIPLFVQHELASFPAKAQTFVIEALELELERWKLHRPEKLKYEYDWDFLSTWELKKE